MDRLLAPEARQGQTPAVAGRQSRVGRARGDALQGNFASAPAMGIIARFRPLPTGNIRMSMPAILPPETIEVESTTVPCDGGGGALGHPLVYLTMGTRNDVECGYCDRKFVLKPGSPRGGH